MKYKEPAYRLEQIDRHEWHFETSFEQNEVDIAFGDLLEQHDGATSLTPKLRKFVSRHPDHIDALHHYAMCKLDDGKPLDAYAFAHAAVAIGRRVVPERFKRGRDFISGGWVENRPFLRALHGLMLAQDAVGSRPAAIATAFEMLDYDPQDRMGARLDLPLMLLQENRTSDLLALFERQGLEDTFHVTIYLKALALLRLDQAEEARACLESCLERYPLVARFILEPQTPQPNGGNEWGIQIGSPFEGWYYGLRFAQQWHTPKSALPLLRELAGPHVAAGWPWRGEPTA